MTTHASRKPRRKSKTFKVTLPSDTANLDIIRKFVNGITENMGFSDEEIYKIELAVDEACANIVNHAYKNDAPPASRVIDVSVRARPDRVEIVIADHGGGFDPQKVQNPQMQEYLKKMKRGGLGIFLMKKMMDEVKFRIKPGVRNEVKLIKYLNRNSKR